MRERTGGIAEIYEHASDGVLLVRLDGTILRANPAACRMVGRPEEGIRGEGCRGLVVEDERLRHLLASASASGSSAGKFTVRRSDRSTFPAEFTAVLVRADEGEPLWFVVFREITGRSRSESPPGMNQALREIEAMLGCLADAGPDSIVARERDSARDVTDQRSAEAALREREYLLSASQRVAHVGTWSWKVGDPKVYWSDETYSIYGLSPEMGPPDYEFFFEIVHPDDRLALREWAEAAVRGLHPPAVEFRVRRPDGSSRVIRTEGDVIETADGVPSRIAGTAYDVTDRHRANEALRESERRYRELFENSPVAMFLSEVVCDSGGRPTDCRFLYVNPAFEAFVRTKAEDLVGRTLLEFNPRTSPASMERQGRVALSGVPDSWEGYSVALEIHYEATVFSPRPGQCVTYLVDISKRVLAEAALREAL